MHVLVTATKVIKHISRRILRQNVPRTNHIVYELKGTINQNNVALLFVRILCIILPHNWRKQKLQLNVIKKLSRRAKPFANVGNEDEYHYFKEAYHTPQIHTIQFYLIS